jgi:hypothetical protein
VKALLWTAVVLVAGFVAIIAIGAALPETPRSRARETCENIKAQSYTPAEKARAEQLCGELMREADRQSGRLQR